MGNSPSNANHRSPPPPPPPPRSRPLKHKKRSIVAHPALLAPPPPVPPIPITSRQPPSAPIPIPSAPGQPPPPRPSPPQPTTNDSFDVDLLHRPPHSTHRPIQYNSTRSFGAVRRGGIQGVGLAPPPNEHTEPLPFVPQLVYSSIPLRIPHAESSRPRRPPPHPDNPSNPTSDDLTKHDPDPDDTSGLIPTPIVWTGGGKKVLLAGTFDPLEWRARERMRFDPVTSTHILTLQLAPGTYRLKFIVDDFWRCADSMATATDDETGNLVNYIDVEDPSLSPASFNTDEERQGRVNQRVMKANRRRTYPAPRGSKPKSPYHPPQLPPSDSAFWGDPDTDTELEAAGWARGRDGVLEKWTNAIPEPLVAVAQQEEAYFAAVQAQREVRRGGAGTRGTLESLGPVGVPNVPAAPKLPRHLDKVLLNARSPHSAAGGGGGSSGGGGGGSGGGSSSKHRGSSRARHGVLATATTTSLLVPPLEQMPQSDDSSVLPVPNHVVLHHLGTSAIKNGVLAVSDTTRYIGKYITTIYYKPA